MTVRTRLGLLVYMWVVSGCDFVPSRSGFGLATNLAALEKAVLELWSDDDDIFSRFFRDWDEGALPTVVLESVLALTAFSYSSKITGFSPLRRFNAFFDDAGQHRLRLGSDLLTTVRLEQIKATAEIQYALCPSDGPLSAVSALAEAAMQYWLAGIYRESGAAPPVPTCLVCAIDSEDRQQWSLELSKSLKYVAGRVIVQQCKCKTTCRERCPCRVANRPCTMACSCSEDACLGLPPPVVLGDMEVEVEAEGRAPAVPLAPAAQRRRRATKRSAAAADAAPADAPAADALAVGVAGSSAGRGRASKQKRPPSATAAAAADIDAPAVDVAGSAGTAAALSPAAAGPPDPKKTKRRPKSSTFPANDHTSPTKQTGSPHPAFSPDGLHTNARSFSPLPTSPAAPPSLEGGADAGATGGDSYVDVFDEPVIAIPVALGANAGRVHRFRRSSL